MNADGNRATEERAGASANRAERQDPGRLRKRSVVIAGHRTSVSLENAFWQALSQIARTREVSVSRLIADIDRDRPGNLSSALRVFVLRELQTGAPVAGATGRAAAARRE